jgi:hypothetical protein
LVLGVAGAAGSVLELSAHPINSAANATHTNMPGMSLFMAPALSHLIAALCKPFLVAITD